jgi:5'-nucleotidase
MILVTNDDGVLSPGIQLLAKRLKELDSVVIVAPDRERSAAGHSMTLHRPLLIEEIRESVYSVNGTPTDCVNIAVKGFLGDPGRLWSGINKGPNSVMTLPIPGWRRVHRSAFARSLPCISLAARRTFLCRRGRGGGGDGGDDL